MAVAKSYEHMEIIGKPFESPKGKLYVRVRDNCGRCGGSGIWHYGPYSGTCFKCQGSGKVSQEVRWYTDEERQKMDAQIEARAEARRQQQELEALRRAGAEHNGFQNGYVIAIYGETYSVKDELKSAGARFNYGLGWYFSDESAVPAKFLEQSIKITWEMVSRNNQIMSDIDVKEVVKQAIPKPISNSDYMGEVGKRIRGLELEVVKFWEGPGYYIHTMEDTFGNVYVWMTSARALEKGTVVRLDATVKKHEEYQGVKQTHLTRPSIKEVKV
jgi:hypothetical protein